MTTPDLGYSEVRRRTESYLGVLKEDPTLGLDLVSCNGVLDGVSSDFFGTVYFCRTTNEFVVDSAGDGDRWFHATDAAAVIARVELLLNVTEMAFDQMSIDGEVVMWTERKIFYKKWAFSDTPRRDWPEHDMTGIKLCSWSRPNTRYHKQVFIRRRAARCIARMIKRCCFFDSTYAMARRFQQKQFAAWHAEDLSS
jgi:hypothetical protein